VQLSRIEEENLESLAQLLVVTLDRDELGSRANTAHQVHGARTYLERRGEYGECLTRRRTVDRATRDVHDERTVVVATRSTLTGTRVHVDRDAYHDEATAPW